MQEILTRVQINMPFRMLVEKYLPLVIEEKINPEIGFDCFALDEFSLEEYRTIATMLTDEGLTVTFHAPFYDLRPGALDRRIRQVTIERLHQVFDLVPYFKPRTVVCHASFDRKYYFTHEEQWLENSQDTWKQFVAMASEMDTTIALENVYEADPSMLGMLLTSFHPEDPVCFCFDTGHCNAFSSTPLDGWMNALGQYIGEIHLHDNSGSGDDHAPVGEGNFPFRRLFEMLRDKTLSPIITFEPHSEENLWRTVRNIKELKLLDYLD